MVAHLKLWYPTLDQGSSARCMKILIKTGRIQREVAGEHEGAWGLDYMAL